MELARIMATHRPAATILFADVAGLFGSAFMADTLADASASVKGMLDNDIVGSSTADDRTTDHFNLEMFAQGIPSTESLSKITPRVGIGAKNDSGIRQLSRFVVEVASNAVTQMNAQMDVRVVNGVQFGVFAEFCDLNFNVRVARANGIALWLLAQAPGTPRGPTLDTSVLTNNSTLMWTAAAAGVPSATVRLWKDNAQFG
ncbi:putative zinc metalloprotease [Mycena crocata]|nr:putative zinc metalloprotease [Mycena crocata]